MRECLSFAVCCCFACVVLCGVGVAVLLICCDVCVFVTVAAVELLLLLFL